MLEGRRDGYPEPELCYNDPLLQGTDWREEIDSKDRHLRANRHFVLGFVQ